MADYYDAGAKQTKDVKGLANWILGDVSAYLNNNAITIDKFKVSPEHLAGLVDLIGKGVLSSKLAKNPQSVADFKAGKDRAIGFLVGQVMKASHGKANPGMVNKMLKEKMQ